MTEISAGLVKELRELTGLGMMECKKALDRVGRRSAQGRGAPAHQERCQGEQGGEPDRRRRRDRRMACCRWQGGRAGGAQLRDRFRGEERGFRRLRQVARRGRGHAQPEGRGGARLARPAGDEDRGEAPGAGAEDRREHDDPPLHAHAGRRASSRCTCTARRSACWSTTRGRRRSARMSRCTSRSPSPSSCRRPRCPPTSSRASARSSSRAPRSRASPPRSPPRWWKARSTSSWARSRSGPALRQGRQADGGEDARREEGARSTAIAFFVVGEGIEKKSPTSRPK